MKECFQLQTAGHAANAMQTIVAISFKYFIVSNALVDKKIIPFTVYSSLNLFYVQCQYINVYLFDRDSAH